MADDIIEADEAAAKRAERQAYMRRYYLEHKAEFIARAKAWKADNSEHAKALEKEAGKKWAAANPDRVKAKMDKWREANRETAREATRKWRAENPDAARDAVRKWAANNPEKVKGYKAKERANNRPKYLANAKAWYAANTERAKAAQLNWRTENPEAFRAGIAKRKARKRNAEGSYTGADIKALYSLQRGRCAYCGVSLAGGYHVDHITPLARGGTNWPKNLQLTCASCNCRKQAADPIEFAQANGKLL